MGSGARASVWLAGLGTLAVPAPALAQITVELGPEEVVVDWQTDRCATEDIPDSSARAFVDASGRVQLLAVHYGPYAYRMIGDNLRDVAKECTQTLMVSHHDADPRHYDDVEWLVAPYTLDGATIYSTVHNEYHGWEHANCNSPDTFQCWWNSITLATSADSGASYQHSAAPTHVIASSAYDFDPDNTSGPFGFFGHSNVFLAGGYYHAFLHVEDHGDQTWGSCLMRTANLADPASWRGWDGNGFGLVMDRAICPPVPDIGTMPESVTYNSYLHSYLMAGARGEPTDFHFTTSTDLTSWPYRQVLMATDVFWTPSATKHRGYAALLQPGDPTRNFERTGRSPWLYYTYWDRDLGLYARDLRRRRVRLSRPEDVGRYDVLALEMNEHRGGATLDSSFYGNDGVLVGGAQLTSASASGPGAIAFPGDGSMVRVDPSVNGPTSLDLAGSLTIEAFVRVAPQASFAVIARKEIDPGQRNYALLVIPDDHALAGRLHFTFSSGGTPVIDGTGSRRVDDGAWHHVAVTYTGGDGTARYYVDGVLDATVVHGVPLGDVNAAPLQVGYELAGTLDAVRIFDHARSDAEIAADAAEADSIEPCSGGLGGECDAGPGPVDASPPGDAVQVVDGGMGGGGGGGCCRAGGRAPAGILLGLLVLLLAARRTRIRTAGTP